MPTAASGDGAAQRVDRPAVRQQEVVRRRDRVGLARATRGVDPPRVPDPRDDPRLVVRDPRVHAIAETRCNGVDVVDEQLCRRAIRPAALVLERLRRVPVEERRDGLDPVREQLVDEAVVEIEAGLVHAPAAAGNDARPRDGEAERVEAELAHERDVLGIAVVEVAGDVARVAVPHLAGRRGEPVPDTLAAPVLGGRAFDLVRRGRSAPEEAGRQDAGSIDCSSEPLDQVVEGMKVESAGSGAVTWQRAACPARASTSAGVTCEHTSTASGQRLTNRHPSGGSTAAEARPLWISIRFASRSASGFAAAESSSRVYGCMRIGQHVLDRPLLDDLAGVHHEDVVREIARAREIVRDVEERDLPFRLQLQHQVQDPDANRDVEHARRLVGEEHDRLDRERACDRDALALTAGELVRVLVGDRAPAGRGRPSRATRARGLRSRPSATIPWISSGRAMWCRIVFTGFSEPNGSWKIICTCDRYCRIERLLRSPATSTPR